MKTRCQLAQRTSKWHLFSSLFAPSFLTKYKSLFRWHVSLKDVEVLWNQVRNGFSEWLNHAAPRNETLEKREDTPSSFPGSYFFLGGTSSREEERGPWARDWRRYLPSRAVCSSASIPTAQVMTFFFFTYNVDKSWHIGFEFFDSMEISHFLVNDDKRFYRVFLVVINRRR